MAVLFGCFIGASIVSSLDGGTMSIELNGDNEEDVAMINIFCNSSDVCNLNCIGSGDACSSVNLYCFGSCWVSCNVNNDRCPIAAYGTFEILDSQSNITTTLTPTNSNYNSKSNVFGFQDLIAVILWIFFSVIFALTVFVCQKVVRFNINAISKNNAQKQADDADPTTQDDDLNKKSNHNDEAVVDQKDEQIEMAKFNVGVDDAGDADDDIADEIADDTNADSGDSKGITSLTMRTVTSINAQYPLNVIVSKSLIVKLFVCNTDFFVTVITCILCLFLGFVCFLYGIGQVTKLELANYWCEKKSLAEIHQHSAEFGLNHGTNDGCWQSKQFTVMFDGELHVYIYS